MKSYFDFIEEKLLSITNDDSDFAPPPSLISLFLAAHSPTTNIPRYSIDAKRIEAAVLAEMAHSTQTANQHFAQFLVLDKSMGHYFAIHAEFNHGKAKLLIIDYYSGFQCNLSHFNESALGRSPDVDLFIAGGEKLQHDYKSCSFFAIAALDAAEKMPDLFDHVTRRRKQNSREIIWQDLPVELVWNAQSLSYIWEHIDHLRKTEFAEFPEDQDIPTLVHPAPRQTKSFVRYLTEGILFKRKKERQADSIIEYSKPSNQSIRVTVARSIVDETLRFLYRIKDHDALIEQLYAKFPSVHLLASELVVRFSDEQGIHPLAKKLFSNPEKYEIGLQHTKLAYILHHPIIQELMWDSEIRDTIVHACFVRDSDKIGAIREEKIEQLATLLLKHLEFFQTMTDHLLSDLIYSKSILAVLDNPELLTLIHNKHLSLEEAVFVMPQNINPTIWSNLSSEEEKCLYLTNSSISPKNPKHKHTQAVDLSKAMNPIMQGGYQRSDRRRPLVARPAPISTASSSSATDKEDEGAGTQERM